MKKINFCKAITIILIINVILSIVLFFVVPDKIAIQWVGTSPSNAVDSYYVFLVPVLSVLLLLRENLFLQCSCLDCGIELTSI